MIAGVLSVEAGREAVALEGERPLRVLSSAAPDPGADPAGPATPQGRVVTRAVRAARERHR